MTFLVFYFKPFFQVRLLDGADSAMGLENGLTGVLRQVFRSKLRAFAKIRLRRGDNFQTNGEDETLSANAVDSSSGGGGDADVRCIKKVMQVCIW